MSSNPKPRCLPLAMSEPLAARYKRVLGLGDEWQTKSFRSPPVGHGPYDKIVVIPLDDHVALQSDVFRAHYFQQLSYWRLKLAPNGEWV